jgi:hypothetical protein
MMLRARPHLLRAPLAAALGLTCALLVACGGSGKGLIPAANAGPLQSDFEAVAQAAESGNGDCSATEAALSKTEQDFAALPTTVDAGLRNTLRQGISNLRSRAMVLCSQPLVQTNTTTTPTVTTPTATTPTVTQTTPTTATPTTTAPSTPSGSHGGTAAPGEEGEEKPGKGPKKEKDHGGAGGAEAGEAGEEEGGGGK